MMAMDVDFTRFDESVQAIFTCLLANYPVASPIGFADVFPEEQADTEKREAHIGVIAYLKHENLIAHETGSASSFILTKSGLALIGKDMDSHIWDLLNDH